MKRVRVTNEGEGDWRALIWAEECRDYKPEDATAEMVYLAKDLTPLGAAEAKEVSGALVVQHTSLTAGWIAVLSSEIDEVGHMTHRGVRRLWIRAYDPGSEAGDVQLQLLWRPLGASRWSPGPIVPMPLIDAWQLVDLGEVRPQVPALGDERWEFKLMARAISGAGAIRIRDVYPLPTEQYGVLREPYEAPVADLASTKSPGTVADDSAVGTLTWSNPTNAKAEDGSYAKAASVGVQAESHYLKLTNFGFAIPEGATVLGIVASIRRRFTLSEGGTGAADRKARIVKGGEIQSAADRAAGAAWGSPETKVFGAADDLWSQSWEPADVNATGFGFAMSAIVGILTTAEVDHVAITVYYTEVEGEAACFASRAVEFRSNGAYRQARGEDDVWGLAVPDGFAPYDTPGGLEERPSRGILIPSQGDLGDLPDVGLNEISAKVITRPGYHYAREAK